MRGLFILAAALFSGLIQIGYAPGAAAQGESVPRVVTSRLLTDNGGHVDWCADRNMIAFDREVERGTHEVFTIRPDGTREKCVTCDIKGMPKGLRGQPAWHPSCSFLAIQVQGGHFRGRAYEHLSWGFHQDLWFVAADGSWARRVSMTPVSGAVLDPHFSEDGRHLVWAERLATGRRIPQSTNRAEQTPGAENPWDGWALAVAEVIPLADNEMDLTARRTLFSRRDGFIEPSTFIGERIWYSRTQTGRPFVDTIFNVGTSGRDAIPVVLDNGVWDDHGMPSPGGRLITFNSSRGFQWHYPPDVAVTLQSELWTLGERGKTHRLTSYNDGLRPGERAISVDYAWSPGGREIAAYAVTSGIGLPRHEIWIHTLDKAY